MLPQYRRPVLVRKSGRNQGIAPILPRLVQGNSKRLHITTRYQQNRKLHSIRTHETKRQVGGIERRNNIVGLCRIEEPMHLLANCG